MRPPDGEGSKRWPEAWVRNVQIFRWSFVSLGIAREWHSGPKLVWWPFKRWSKTSSKLKTGWLPQKHQARHPEIQGVDGTITATKGIWCICFGGLWSHSYETTRGGFGHFLTLIPTRWVSASDRLYFGPLFLHQFFSRGETYRFPPLRLHWKMSMLTSTQLGRSHDS